MRCLLAVRAAFVVTVLSTQSGCALMFAKGPPEDHAERERFECTESARPVVSDLLWGIPTTAVLALGAAMSDERASFVYPAVTGTLTLVSVFVGAERIEACREATEALWERRRAARPPPPGVRSAPGATRPLGTGLGSGWDPLRPSSASAPPPGRSPGPGPTG
jgi:hypothetical protein